MIQNMRDRKVQIHVLSGLFFATRDWMTVFVEKCGTTVSTGRTWQKNA